MIPLPKEKTADGKLDAYVGKKIKMGAVSYTHLADEAVACAGGVHSPDFPAGGKAVGGAGVGVGTAAAAGVQHLSLIHILLADGGYQYVSNHILTFDHETDFDWYSRRLTVQQWEEKYGFSDE